LKSLYSDNRGTVESAIKELMQEDDSVKSSLVNTWNENVCFANGIQHMSNFGRGGFSNENGNRIFEEKESRQKNFYKTNEIAPIVRTLVSFLTRARPALTVGSADKTEKSKLSADFTRKVMDAKYDLDAERECSRMAAYWGLLTGTAFRKDYYDYTLGPLATLPVLDEMGNEVIDPETGQPQVEQKQVGNNVAVIKTPYEIGCDFSVNSFEDISYIHESYLTDVEWVRESFDREGDGYTGLAGQVTGDNAIGLNLQSLQQLRFTSDVTGSSKVPGKSKEKTTVTEFYIKPNRDKPKGRMLVIAGGVCVYDSDRGEYVFDGMSGSWHPYTPWVYEPFVGRLFGKSLVAELVPLQRRLNEINESVLKNANTVGQVDMLASNLSKFAAKNFEGGGGKVYTWSGVGPTPEKWQGMPLPIQFFNERQTLVDQMVRIAGTNFVMSGNAPSGVTAAAALEMLLQNASSQQSDTSITWEQFHERGYCKKMNVIKKFAEFPNADLSNYLQSMTGDALSTELDAFIGSDIADGVNLKIEAGSMMPKMEKFKRDSLMSLLKEGALGPVNEDSPRGAVLREKIQKEMGIYDLELDDTKDVEKAKWENSRLQSKKSPDPQEFDSHEIHIYILHSMLKDPLYIERSDEEVRAACMEHLKWHEEQIAIKQQQQQQQQQEMMQQQMQMGAQAKGQEEEIKEQAKLETFRQEEQIKQQAELGVLPLDDLPISEEEQQEGPLQ